MMPYSEVKTLHELSLINQQQHKENKKLLDDITHRLKTLEEFQSRIKIGQKWLLCAAASLGGMIAASYYLLSSWHLVAHRP